MTLIQNAHFGGIVTVMTSDTRQTSKMFGIERRYKDAENKIGRISPYCVFGGGGHTMLVDAIKEEIKGSALYIGDFKESLERVIEAIKQRPFYSGLFMDESATQILISGFNKDGSSGFVSYVTGKGEDVRYRQLEVNEQEYHIISPSDDEMRAALSIAVMPPVHMLEELPGAVISYAAQIQSAFYTNDEETVSEKFNYCAIYHDNDNGEFKCFEGQLDLTESME